MSLLETLREEIGLPMRGSYPPYPSEIPGEGGEVVPCLRQRFIGWTTDAAKAGAARDAGATVTPYRASEAEYDGWEITLTEVIESDRDT